MNFASDTRFINLLKEKEFCDVIILVEDADNSIELGLHKIILAYASEYFQKMFLFDKSKNSFVIEADNASVMADVIMTFYGFETSASKLNLPDWYYQLQIFKCRNFLCLKNDLSKIYYLKVPAEGFQLLLEIIFVHDLLKKKEMRLIRLVKENLPIALEKLDSSDILGPGNDWLKKELLKKSKLLVSGDAAGYIKVWNITDHDSECICSFEAHENAAVLSISFSPDNSLILSSSSDKTIKIWDFIEKKYIRTLSGHSDWVNSALFSADGKLIVSASDDKTIKIWNVETGNCIDTLSNHHRCWIYKAVFSNCGKFIISIDIRGQIIKWDANNGTLIDIIHKFATWSDAIINFKKNQPDILKDTNLKITNIHRGPHDSYNNTNSISFSHDNQMIACGKTDGNIYIQNIDNIQDNKTLIGHIGQIECVTFYDHDMICASCGIDKSIKIWDLYTNSCIMTLDGHSVTVYSIDFSN